MLPEFTGKQREIIQGLMHGEDVREIAVRLDTTPAYIYNVRAKARRMGLTFNPPRDPTQQYDNQRQQQSPLNIDPSPDSRTSVSVHPPTNLTVTPQPHDDFDYAEAFRYIDYVKRVFSQPAPLPPKLNLYEELNIITEQNVKILWQMVPYAVLFGAMLRNK